MHGHSGKMLSPGFSAGPGWDGASIASSMQLCSSGNCTCFLTAERLGRDNTEAVNRIVKAVVVFGCKHTAK